MLQTGWCPDLEAKGFDRKEREGLAKIPKKSTIEIRPLPISECAPRRSDLSLPDVRPRRTQVARALQSSRPHAAPAGPDVLYELVRVAESGSTLNLASRLDASEP